ncbi:TerC family protein [Cobetia sp. L2A1]|uniref:TerC family protein n=1 Tax=Cobetia sp. L2A1 TaxID=2686360 RepID=UPI00131D92E9|nr:TerC family protein [Cobetia sp. L2A1]
MEWLMDPSAWVALATLTALEIVLGIDNIIFLSILVARLPESQRQRGRMIGLGLAMGMRIVLLLSLSWLMSLTTPLFSVADFSFSGRDLILVFGGLFLLGKSTHEIHANLEGEDPADEGAKKGGASFMAIMIQIALIDIVFSLDSVITAVGMVDHLTVMIIAIVISVGIMMVAAKPIGDFVDRHPTIKMLALSFLIMVGMMLMVEGFGVHVPKGYIYVAMAFSLAVEMLNIRLRGKRAKTVRLRRSSQAADTSE